MDEQKMLLENLKSIKDYWVNESVSSLLPDADLSWSEHESEYRLLQSRMANESERQAIMHVQDELVRGVIHSILVMIDGGDALADVLEIDLINANTKASLKCGTALHEEFIGYLLETEE